MKLNRLNKLSRLITGILLLLSSASLFATPIVITDSSQLDFEGDFVFALNFFGSSDVSIGDANFDNVAVRIGSNPNGFSMTGFNRNTSWSAGSDIGTGANNDALESILSTIVWSGEVRMGAMSFDLLSGHRYKVQLLFSECCDNRNFSITSSDGQFYEEYQGGNWKSSTTQGYLSTWDFVATDTGLNLDFQRMQVPGGDSNYHISGLTIEQLSQQDPITPVSAPSTMSILGIALLGLLCRRRKH
mgnify:CR=1 FL=1